MERVGRYRVVARLASGGMADVLEAVAEGEGGFERRVAIKRMRDATQGGEALARMFLDEARIASRLHHASIVAVLDYGVVDGLPFQVLELVDGASAAELSARGRADGAPMPEAVALHVCAEVAHALAHAHTQRDAAGRPLGIVHRDVSPSNVLVSWSGDVKLADFGIAKARDRTQETEDGVTKGTLAYMSPEQASGGAVDARSDVFSLGCVLHTLLTGASPLAGRDAMAALFRGEAIRLDPTLAEDLRALLARALAAEPSRRFASAHDMADALGAAAATRMERDARSTLTRWLEAVRPTARPTRGKLDALLDLDLVLDAEADGVRTFHAITSARTAAEPVAAGARDRRSTRNIVASAVLAALGLGALGFVFFWPGRAPSEAPPAREAPVSPVPEPAPQEVLPPPREAPVNPTPEPSDPATPRDPPRPPRLRVTAPPETIPSPPTTPLAGPPEIAPTSAAGEAHGELVIGGAGAHRAEIFVDGVSVGFAPRRLALPLGPHAVLLVAPDGARVGPETITLTARHTRLSPARWMLE